MKLLSIPRICGGLVLFIALLVAVGRLLQAPALVLLVPGGDQMGMLTLVLMIAAGSVQITLSRGWQRLPRSLRVMVYFELTLMALIPLGFLMEAFTGIALGIDLPPAGSAPTLLNPTPGRISPNAAIAFLAVAAAFFCLTRRSSSWSSPVAVSALVAAGAISFAALVGQALGLDSLYQVAGFNRMRTGTAIALLACVVGVWPLVRPVNSSLQRGHKGIEQRINLRAAIMFALVAVVGGIAGFAVMRNNFEESAALNLLATTRTTATAIGGEIEANLWYPKVIAERSSVQIALAGLHRKLDRKATIEKLERIADTFFNQQVIGAQFLDSDGTVLYNFGHFLINPAVRHSLRKGQTADLLWSDGYVLETRNEIRNQGMFLGSLVVQTRLPRFDAALTEVRHATPSTDAVICGKSGPLALCAPTRVRPIPFTLDLNGDPTSAAATIALALKGQSGTQHVRDPQGLSVISAYVPIKDFGIVLGVKTEVAALYAPLRGRLIELVVVLVAVISAGVLALRGQLRPLISALAREQRRTANILENSNDAFVALDIDGCVTDWNGEAVRMFGWTAREAVGQRLSSLIVPPSSRGLHDQGMKAFRATGTGAVVNRRIELLAMHRDGHLIPVELSVRAEEVGDEYLAHAFLHDISERKAAEAALLQSEKRAKLIANNLPALVSYIDQDYRYTFTNNQYQRWFGLSEDALVGKTVEQVFGRAGFDGVLDQITRALRGEDVMFELESCLPDSPKYLLFHYVPDRDKHGTVVGVFGMVLDRTEQFQAQKRVEASERQLRVVTDNLPILITYVDSDERLRFMNGTFRDWLGIDLESAINRPLADVLGEKLYEPRREQLRKALTGQRVEFDIASDTLAGLRHLHTVYIPDVKEDGRTHGVFTVSMDITPLKNIEGELRELARIDSLTSLPNRRQFEERLDEALARSHRGGTPITLMFLDVDIFKSINDQHGHGVGDTVLKIFASRLRFSVRDCDFVARLGGDEFVIILEGLVSRGDVSVIAEKLLDAIRVPFDIGGQFMLVTSSMGVACYSGGEGIDRHKLLDCADQALYRTKEGGRDGFMVFTIEGTDGKPLDTA